MARTRRYVNLFSRRGVLGSPPMYHLSEPYSNEGDAIKGRSVLPDARWTFAATLFVVGDDIATTPTSAPEKLRAAAVLVADVIDTLNASTKHCDSCSRDHPVDPIEAKAHQMLSQTREKLLEWADTLYLPKEHRRDSPGARRARARRPRRHGPNQSAV
jgi:hypothetical protein